MPRAGTTLGRYRLLDRIGAGGMGEVRRAHDANVDRSGHLTGPCARGAAR